MSANICLLHTARNVDLLISEVSGLETLSKLLWPGFYRRTVAVYVAPTFFCFGGWLQSREVPEGDEGAISSLDRA
jgi:hypothetical protein